ncbi:signal transducer and activator of transcription 3-like [Littorina saxatilis]|uniref:signal transducer and activator of transcription 3-like n=1 Tax=Littorina saxatilis TaxID=31220 RepID=UPI0038B44441
MSRYAKLQELLKENPDSCDLSFYPDYLLNFRSILSDWVEKQDWSEGENISGNSEQQTKLSQKLLDEALALLKAKEVQAGFELTIRNIETQLKKKYAAQPMQFVYDMSHCLQQEGRLTDKMMTQAMNVDDVTACMPMSANELDKRITDCRNLDEKITQVVTTAHAVLKKWQPVIEAGDTEQRDVFGTGQMIKSPHFVFYRLKQDLDLKTKSVVEDLDVVLAALPWHIQRWKTEQMYRSVYRKSEGMEDMRYVENLCEQVCFCVNNLLKCAVSPELQAMDSMREKSMMMSNIPTPAISSRFNNALKDILRRIVEMFFMVIDQPELTMMIEKEKGVRDKDDTNSSKKFSTTVGILGGKGFGESLTLSEMDIYLAFNHDLAEGQEQNKKPRVSFRIHHESKASKRASRSLDSREVTYQNTYDKLRVESFSRKETKSVYKQLYHVVYDATITFPQLMQEIKAHTLSLPIIVRTGAVQASEHVGAQLWHSFSSPNMYDLRAEMATSMKVDDAIQMINERVLFANGRGLRDYERAFLRERLVMAASGKGDKTSPQAMITLDTFIKDKVTLPRQGSPNEKDTMSFSLWRWLHSVVNLLHDTLKDLWSDGHIYGFASREQCRAALEDDPNVQDGTFLLRFSESSLSGNHMMSKGALAVVVKKDGLAAFAPPIEAEKIERHGLAHLIENIGCQRVLGTNLHISELKQVYPALIPESSVQNRYLGWSKKEIFVNEQSYSNPASPASSLPAQPPPQQKPPLKAKRRSQNSKVRADTSPPSSKQVRAYAPESPESTTSSVASPMPMSPPSAPHNFQPVGYRMQRQLSSNLGSPPPSNIPSVVMSEMSGSEADQDSFMLLDSSTMDSFQLQPGQQLVQLTSVAANETVMENFGSEFSPGMMATSGISTLTQVSSAGSTPTNFLVGPGDPVMMTPMNLQQLQADNTGLNLEDMPMEELQNLVLHTLETNTS